MLPMSSLSVRGENWSETLMREDLFMGVANIFNLQHFIQLQSKHCQREIGLDFLLPYI